MIICGRRYGRPSGREPLPRTPLLPVIGIPVKGGAVDGLDALLATVQMPSGIPVATVALGRRQKRRRAGRPDAGHRTTRTLSPRYWRRPGRRWPRAIAEKDAAHPGGGAAETCKECFPNIIFIFSINTNRGRRATWKSGNSCMREKPRRFSPQTTRTLYIVDYKDDATAGNGAKKGTIRGQGRGEQPGLPTT